MSEKRAEEVADEEHAGALMRVLHSFDVVGDEPIQKRIDHRRRELRHSQRRRQSERYHFRIILWRDLLTLSAKRTRLARAESSESLWSRFRPRSRGGTYLHASRS